VKENANLTFVCVTRSNTQVLSMGQIGKGFERLLESVDDLALDCPHAKQFLAQVRNGMGWVLTPHH
jgi:hypothetical protein